MNLSRLVSKKLTLALVTVGGLIAAHAYAEAAAVAVAYVTSQGVIDLKTAQRGAAVIQNVIPVAEAVAAELVKPGRPAVYQAPGA